MVTTALSGNCVSCRRGIRSIDSAVNNVALFKDCKHQFHLECLNRDVLRIYRECVNEVNEFTCMGRGDALSSHNTELCVSTVHIKVVEGDTEDSLKVLYNQTDEEKAHKKVEIFEVGASGSMRQVRHIPIELNPLAAHDRVMDELTARFGVEREASIEDADVPEAPVVQTGVRGEFTRRVASSAGMLLNLASVAVVAAFAFSYFSAVPAICMTATMLALSFTLQARLSSVYSGERAPVAPQEEL
ncbi:MAG: hypothetical protein S4CHLAM37_12490 [Chlamydiia bacterium]|nr:hypothetical protein [Chlamydiia bacterium]